MAGLKSWTVICFDGKSRLADVKIIQIDEWCTIKYDKNIFDGFDKGIISFNKQYGLQWSSYMDLQTKGKWGLTYNNQDGTVSPRNDVLNILRKEYVVLLQVMCHFIWLLL